MGRPNRLLYRGEVAQRASFLELFFDLVLVFALTRISDAVARVLVTEPSASEFVSGVGKSFFLLFTLMSLWHLTAWVTSRYDPYHPAIQLVVIIGLVASMVMGVAISKAFSTRGLAFAGAYVTARVARTLVLLYVLRGHERRPIVLRALITYSATGILWIAGAVLVDGGWIRGTLWTLALGTEYVSTRAGWPVPGLGRSTTPELHLAGEHLGERYQQVFLVALGEAILVTGRIYSEGSFGAGHTVAFAVALATSVLFWWIYFHRAGLILPEAVRASPFPAHMARSTADSHLIMMAGVVATAVGYELVIQHPYGPSPLEWLAVALGGPALFTVGRARFEYEVFARVSPSRIVTLVVLVALVPVMAHLPPLAALIAAAVVLTAAAIADARRARTHPPEPPSPPGATPS